MFFKHNKRCITIIAAVLFLLVQFAATVHASDHVFHAEDVHCLSLNSVEQNKLLFHAAIAIYRSGFISHIIVAPTSLDINAIGCFSFHSRAPPVYTV